MSEVAIDAAHHASLLNLASRLGGVTTSCDVAKVVIQEVAQVVGAARCVVYERRADRGYLSLLAAIGFEPELASTMTELPLTSRWPLARAIVENRAFWWHTYEEALRELPELRDAATPASEIQAIAAIPLTSGGAIVGGIAFSFTEVRRFDRDERAFLAAVAGLCAQAIDRARLFESERSARERAEHFAEQTRAIEIGSRRLSAAISFAGVADAVLGCAAPALGADTAGLWLAEPERNTLRRIGQLGFRPALEEVTRTLAIDDPAPVAAAYRNGEPEWLQSYAEYSQKFPQSAQRIRELRGPEEFAVACFPLRVGDRVLGSMFFGFERAREFGLQDRSFMQILAEYAAQAIDRARLFQDQQRARAAAERYGEHLRKLQAITVALAAAPTAREVATIIVREARAMLAADHSVLARGIAGDRLHVLAHNTLPPEVVLRYGELDANSTLPIAIAYRTGSVFVAETQTSLYEQAPDAREAAVLRALHAIISAPIRTAVELMKLHPGSCDQRIREVIDRQVNHMARLVDDLLDVSRITQGRIELERKPVDLAKVLANAVEQASPLFESKTHHLAIVVPEGVLRVLGDQTRLAQVFSNLLHNAAKYSREGSQIQLAAHLDRDHAIVSVRDHGIGIDPELLPHVFDQFMQAPQAISRSQGGLGLGLAIVKKLVEMHGGEVVARSAGAGKGSEFEVRLPLHRAEPSEDATAPARPPLSAAASTTILVIEDNQDVAEMLAQFLTEAGYPTRVAFDGPSALQAAAEAPPDVALIDIGLPVMDGYEVCRRFTRLPNPPRLLVAVTGYGQPDDALRAREAGFHLHMVKPVDIHQIIRAIGALPRS
ncbi:MAG TPA: ATP-binding protein [Kofleriaceae bacterium]